MASKSDDERARLLEELQAIPKSDRLEYLASLPPDRRATFKRVLPREDIKKLNSHIDRLVRQRRPRTTRSGSPMRGLDERHHRTR